MNLTIDLPDDVAAALEAKAAEQGVSPSEVVRAGLRLLEEREQEEQAKLAWLRAAVKEGLDQLDRGEGIEFESMDDLAAYVDDVAAEIDAEMSQRSQK